MALSMIGKTLMMGMTGRDRPADPIARLRFVLETMPGTRKYTFTPMARAEILSELYGAFWGMHSHLFLQSSNSSLPMHALLSEVQAYEDVAIPGRACAHVFRRGESCYRCKDCLLDDSCLLCSKCFHATDHTGHTVTFYVSQQPGGSCDCGDPEAWREPRQCSHHPPGDSHGTPKPGQSANWSAKSIYSASVPPELRDSMSKTIAYALDFVLDTLDYSPDETPLPADENELRRQPSADPLEKDLFTVIIWNDEKHSFDEVLRTIQDVTGCSAQEAKDMTYSLEANGREVIITYPHTARMLEMAQTIGQIELGVTIRRAYDTFREQIAAVIIEWVRDLTVCKLGNDSMVLREVIASELFAPRKKDSSSLTTNQEASKVYAEVKDPARLDWLLLYHTRFWKKPRLSLRQIYVACLAISQEHKLTIALHFASVYHRIIDAYLLVDREPETSIKYFALQLFTVPSVAVYIVRNNSIISRLLAIITAFFTNQISGKRIIFPPNPHADVDTEAFPFRSKRFMPVFSDLRYICNNETVQKLIARNHDFIAQFSRVCQLFMGISPNKRAAVSHVEFESDSWITVFNVTLSLSRVIKAYGEAYSQGTAADLVAAITTVIHHILMVCTLSDDRLDKTKYETISFHEVVFGDSSYNIIDFDVMTGWISFHHALHWLLAELFKHVDILSHDTLRSIGMRNLREIILRNASERAVLTVVDFPLRVLAMTAQIRTGLWVRNGFAIRGQLLHYRDFMLRELCYDQDLFILQTSFVILPPNIVMVTILDRFQLLHWFSGRLIHPAYEGDQLIGMVEEFLYILITCVSEYGNCLKLTMRESVRREIVHALAIGPCSFTELCKRVAERMVDDLSFEHVLAEVATFKPPEGANDVGLYVLKDESFDEVNPFFFHYSRTRREDVEPTLRARLTRKTGLADPVIVPKRVEIPFGPFVTLSRVFHSDVMIQVIFFGIFNIVCQAPVPGAESSTEGIVDQCLHLIMLGIVQEAPTFCTHVIDKKFDDIHSPALPRTLLHLLCVMEHDQKYKQYKAKIQWCLDRITNLHPADVSRLRQGAEGTKSSDSENARKRAAAQARKDHLMKQFAVAQQTFLDNFGDEDDEDDARMEDQADRSPGQCIVCQEKLDQTRPFGALSMIQASRLIRRAPSSGSHLKEVLLAPSCLDRSEPVATQFPPIIPFGTEPIVSVSSFKAFPLNSTRFGLHALACGHMIHLECFGPYSLSIRHRHRQQANRNQPENIDRKEFMCPLCKSLSNALLPVQDVPSISTTPTQSFPDWMRSISISILRSAPDRLLESTQFKTGTGEFVFWGAEDLAYQPFAKLVAANPGAPDPEDIHRILDTVMFTAKPVSVQSRHLRDRNEPETTERGAGMYLPEEFGAYTIQAIEIALRGQGGTGINITDNLSESHVRTIRGLVSCLAKLAQVEFRSRPDKGRNALRQAIIKRFLPEWTREPTYRSPFLLRNPFTLLVEAAAIAPEMLHHLIVLAYYAYLARTAIGLVALLSQAAPGMSLPTIDRKQNTAVLGDVKTFVLSVVRHSALLEHAAEKVLSNVGEARFAQLFYAFSLPFLRCAAILAKAITPSQLSSPGARSHGDCEYKRLLKTLGIPWPTDLSQHDAIQAALAGWCAHYGVLHSVSPPDAIILLDFPCIYQLAQLPPVLDALFGPDDDTLMCTRCNTIPVEGAICLICGTACCFQSHCCRDTNEADQGECNMHTRECGGVIGLYFLVKRCSLLYLFGGKGSFAPAPYLDVHGEIDHGMRRGRRQYLHPYRVEEVRKTWLAHGIPSYVARKLEGTVDPGGWDTV